MIIQTQTTIQATTIVQQRTAFTTVPGEDLSRKKERIEPQRPFVRTKKSKKQQSRSSIVPPTSQERQQIAMSLLADDGNISCYENTEETSDC